MRKTIASLSTAIVALSSGAAQAEVFPDAAVKLPFTCVKDDLDKSTGARMTCRHPRGELFHQGNGQVGVMVVTDITVWSARSGGGIGRGFDVTVGVPADPHTNQVEPEQMVTLTGVFGDSPNHFSWTSPVIIDVNHQRQNLVVRNNAWSDNKDFSSVGVRVSGYMVKNEHVKGVGNWANSPDN